MKVSRLLAFAVLAAAQPVFEKAEAQATYSTTQVASFSDQQLDNLVAPIALYPDPILAQVLVAATFPDQIEFAARFVRSNGTRNIDDQSWDISVKAVAHYLPLLNMLAERLDWTTSLGQAYAIQSSDVMDAVQRLREMARAQGNLESTDQQRVIVERERILIVPAQPQVIYVPTYDPYAVYFRPVVFVRGFSSFWSFGIGFPIGGWLSYDCDWWGRRVYYDGWRGDGWGGWRHHSRPFIHVTNVYIHPRYEVVHVNRTVIHRTVNYRNLRPYNAVHRTVLIERRGGPENGRGNGGGYGGGNGRPGDDGRDDGRRTVDTRPGDVDRRLDDRGGNSGGRNDDGRPGNGNTNGRTSTTQPRGSVQYPDRVEQRTNVETPRETPRARSAPEGRVVYGDRPAQVVTPSRQPTTTSRQPTTTSRPPTTSRERPTQPEVRTERPRVVTPSRQAPPVRMENMPAPRVESRQPTRQSSSWGGQPTRSSGGSGSVSTGRVPSVSRSTPPATTRSAPSTTTRSAPSVSRSSPRASAPQPRGKGPKN